MDCSETQSTSVPQAVPSCGATLDFAEPQLRIIDAVFRNSPDRIVVIDRDYRYIYVGVVAARAAGMTPEAMLGLTLNDLGVSPETFAEMSRLYEQVFVTAQPVSAEIALPTVEGERDYEFTLSAVQDEDGNIRAVLFIGRDVSARKRAEREREALHRHAANQATEFRAVIDSILDGVYIGTEAGIRTANKPALEMLGLSSLEELNQNIALLSERLHNRDAATGARIPPQDEPFARALKGERVIQEVCTRNLQTGQDLVVRCAAAPILHEGVIVGAVAVNTDITAHRQTEIERGRLAAIVTSSEDAIISKTLDGIITTWNTAAEHIFGYRAAEVIGKPKTLLFPPDHLGEEDEILARVRRGERVEHLETKRVRKDGAVIDVALTIFPVKNEAGTIMGASSIERDISREMAMRHELVTLNARLRSAMQETHHRVKNNLQIIAAMLDMNIHEYADALPMAHARRLQQQVLLLARIHDILTENSKNTTGPEDRVSVKQILTRLLSLLNATVGTNQITQDIDEVHLSLHQVTSLGLIVNELINNAVKHGQGAIYVTFRVGAETAQLVIEDDGPGLPAGFDYRAQANTGLALVDMLTCHDLGGSIAFTNRPEGIGTRVTLDLPIIAPDRR